MVSSKIVVRRCYLMGFGNILSIVTIEDGNDVPAVMDVPKFWREFHAVHHHRHLPVGYDDAIVGMMDGSCHCCRDQKCCRSLLGV